MIILYVPGFIIQDSGTFIFEQTKDSTGIAWVKKNKEEKKKE